jgi:MFS family permease
MLIVGRAVAGLGGSGLFVGLFTIIAACVPVAKRPMYLGITMGLSGIGLVAGPVSYPGGGRGVRSGLEA